MPREFVHLTADQWKVLPPEKTVFFFAVGPLEEHGPHLPVGMDLLESSMLARMAAEKLEKEKPGWVGVIMPPAPLGIESNTTGPLHITVRAHVLRDWLVDACRSLVRAGFFHFVCFSGHLGPRQLTAIEEAGKQIGRDSWKWLRRKSMKPTLVSASSVMLPAGWKKSLFFPDPLEHAGERDTAVALSMSPAMVEFPFASLPAVARGGSDRIWRRLTHKRTGYWGNPAAAKPETGQRELQVTLDHLWPKLQAVWEGSNPNMIFRSWYSVVPTNKSFFKAWLMVIVVISSMIVWIFFTLNSGLGRL